MNIIQIGIFVIFFVVVLGLPVQKKPEVEDHNPKNPEGQPLEKVLEYERYLKEVVDALESDPEFRKKLDKAQEVDIRSGKIAQELDYVSHHVRTRLDEIKRREIERLRQLASQQYELSNNIDRKHLKIGEHLNHENIHTFEVDDLKKLILKTSQDLAEADRIRREEFKQYELQKEFEKQQMLSSLDEQNRKKYQENLQKLKAKANTKHKKVHHPGNQAQLEEVWEKQDHMEGLEFDPKTFFAMHDVDSNGVWDEDELKALFIKELDKVYQPGAPENDLREREEEMERMREHVFQESDTNHDGLISYKEFLDHTKREEFKKDPGWDTLENIPQYTHEEYLEFERQRQAEVQKLIEQGVLPSTPKIPEEYRVYHPNEIINNHPSQYHQQQFVPQGVHHQGQQNVNNYGNHHQGQQNVNNYGNHAQEGNQNQGKQNVNNYGNHAQEGNQNQGQQNVNNYGNHAQEGNQNQGQQNVNNYGNHHPGQQNADKPRIVKPSIDI